MTRTQLIAILLRSFFSTKILTRVRIYSQDEFVLNNKLHSEELIKIEISSIFKIEDDEDFAHKFVHILESAYTHLLEEISEHINMFIEEQVYSVEPLSVDRTKHKESSLNNKCALVTGAAQGFGYGLAEFLVSSGARVYLSDINSTKLEECVTQLSSTYGEDRVYSIQMDCSDESAVAKSAEKVISEMGGIDLIVSNAGIVISGDLESMSSQSMKKMLDVNYMGYFYLTKYFSHFMRYQAIANKEYFSDIIQINSKSGLEASYKNCGYAGSKFGGIGLTGSFALELIEYNIKVNAICPGNFYEGPAWSDPEKGLFKQYLESGKVEGAKTIEDVKQAYQDKSPIKRGCRIQDVCKALTYLVDQSYEIGQSLTVSGGQVMLH